VCLNGRKRGTLSSVDNCGERRTRLPCKHYGKNRRKNSRIRTHRKDTFIGFDEEGGLFIVECSAGEKKPVDTGGRK